jgi:hypothetical protein
MSIANWHSDWKRHFMCRKFVEDSVHVPLLLSALGKTKRWITEACANICHGILQKVWQEVKYQFHIDQATSGARVELY